MQSVERRSSCACKQQLDICRYVEAGLLYSTQDRAALKRHVECVEDTHWLRDALPSLGLVAFVGDGSILPRRAPCSILKPFWNFDHSTLERGRIILTLPIMLLQSQNLETLCGGANNLKQGGRRMSFLRVREKFIAGRVGPQMNLWLPRMRCHFWLQPAWPLSSVCRIGGKSRGWPSAKASPS